MGFDSVSPERPLSVTESRSSICISAPLTDFNIYLSEVSPFRLLMRSEMPPALDFSFNNFIFVQVDLLEFGNQVLMVWHNSVLVEPILWLPLLVRRIWLNILLGLSSFLKTRLLNKKTSLF